MGGVLKLRSWLWRQIGNEGMSLIAAITKDAGNGAHPVLYETVARQCSYALAATNRTFCGERTLLHDFTCVGTQENRENAGGCAIRLTAVILYPSGAYDEKTRLKEAPQRPRLSFCGKSLGS